MGVYVHVAHVHLRVYVNVHMCVWRLGRLDRRVEHTHMTQWHQR